MGATLSIENQEVDPITGAGILFTDGVHCLAGLQMKKNKWILSGLGGKREEDEPLYITALRECLEELLGLNNISQTFLYELYANHLPQRCFIENKYCCYVYNFIQLEAMLKSIHTYGLTSLLYETIPLTVSDLLFKRLPNATEVPTLAIVPIGTWELCPMFQNDLISAKKGINNSMDN